MDYKEYKKNHIEHHNTCPLCKGETIRSNLYEGYRECNCSVNEKGEGYFFKPKPPLNESVYRKKLKDCFSILSVFGNNDKSIELPVFNTQVSIMEATR